MKDLIKNYYGKTYLMRIIMFILKCKTYQTIYLKKIVSSLVERCVKTKYEYFKMPTIHNSFNGLVSKYSKLNEFMNSFSLSLAIKDTDYRVKGDFRDG
jgi:hypothetical protein